MTSRTTGQKLTQKEIERISQNTNARKGNVASEKSSLSVSEQRSIRALEEQIRLHEKKLEEHIKDPYSY